MATDSSHSRACRRRNPSPATSSGTFRTRPVGRGCWRQKVLLIEPSSRRAPSRSLPDRRTLCVLGRSVRRRRDGLSRSPDGQKFFESPVRAVGFRALHPLPDRSAGVAASGAITFATTPTGAGVAVSSPRASNMTTPTRQATRSRPLPPASRPPSTPTSMRRLRPTTRLACSRSPRRSRGQRATRSASTVARLRALR